MLRRYDALPTLLGGKVGFEVRTGERGEGRDTDTARGAPIYPLVT